MMLSDREIIRDLAIEHVAGEGDWQCVCAPAGDDDDD